MKTATSIALMGVRILGLIQIVLGALFWIGIATSLVPVHMLVGSLFVIALWVLAVIALRAGVQPGFPIVTILWGLLIPIFGVTQGNLLVGPAHWVIEVLHLLVGLIGMGLGDRLARRIQDVLASGRAVPRGATPAR